MIKVLIADDERIIREGLAFGVDWSGLDMQVVGLAGDGSEAYKKILKEKPDLVIIDIRMPEMTGLDVIKAVRERPDDKTTFIILSGYNEFSYAQQAVSYGVLEYILKPTEDEKLFSTLERVGAVIKREKKREEFERQLQKDVERQMPILREHLIKDYITNSYFDSDDFEYYKKYFDFENDVRMVLYQIADETSIEETFSLKSLISKKAELFGEFMCLSIRNHLLLIVQRDCTDKELIDLLTDINNYFHEFYDSNLHVIYTKKQQLKVLPYIYTQAIKCTSYSFYLSDEYIISMESILERINTGYDAAFNNYDEITDNIISGNMEMVSSLINAYFDNLTNACFDVHITKTYLTELYMRIIRCTKDTNADDFIRETFAFSQTNSINDIKEQIMRLALSVTESNYNDISYTYSQNIRHAIRYVDEHLSDNTLTLKYLCNNILFINVDYFGRLFKKETGQKFTRYMTLKRIDAAKKIIAEGKANNIFEIAQMVGFGDGAQYFSQVFRKITGYTPTEYKEMQIYLQEDNGN